MNEAERRRQASQRKTYLESDNVRFGIRSVNASPIPSFTNRTPNAQNALD